MSKPPVGSAKIIPPAPWPGSYCGSRGFRAIEQNAHIPHVPNNATRPKSAVSVKPVLPWRFILAIGHRRDATSSRELEVKADALEPEDDQPGQVTHRPLGRRACEQADQAKGWSTHLDSRFRTFSSVHVAQFPLFSQQSTKRRGFRSGGSLLPTLVVAAPARSVRLAASRCGLRLVAWAAWFNAQRVTCHSAQPMCNCRSQPGILS